MQAARLIVSASTGDANFNFVYGGTAADTIDGGAGDDMIALANDEFVTGEVHQRRGLTAALSIAT